ncbi:STAS domain-containing protein [Longispora albida]|uniref:STAS domain-containing protein n=1 Tax=Longispora albida TaxID=203523 RepID=UPI000367AD24|nr:STAS domain-containing protein [Longispora albida]
MELSLETEAVADRTLLRVSGEIDVYTAPKLRERLVELADSGAKDIVVDLELVEFLDSTGLGVLVGGLKRAKASSGSFVLVCDQPRLLKIFRITGLEKVFELYPTVTDALSGAR